MSNLNQTENIEALSVAIDQELPQTQCEKCGFKGCLPYAQALARGESEINRCVPGGEALIKRLALLLNRPVLPLNPACGAYQVPQVVSIVEALCIGCTKCIQACPVDAIVGAKKQMHTVIKDDCTGCELCIPACPLDCIEIQPNANYVLPDAKQIGLDEWMLARAHRAKANFANHQARLENLSRITDTVLPQAVKLADHTDSSNMLDFIAKAKQKAKDKYVTERNAHTKD